MKILVPFKRVADPDNANKIKVSGDSSRVVTEGLEWKVNPFDEYALEAALRLNENGATKESLGQTILVSIGSKDAAQTLRQGLAMGADKAILIEANEDALDSVVVARALREIVKREQPDVIVMGKQAVDGDSNTAGQMLAEMSSLPMATFAMSIVTADGGKTFTVGREVDTGVLTLKATAPLVITVDLRIVAPHAVKNGVTPTDFAYPEGARYASLKGIMAAKKKPIEELTLASLGVDGTATTRMVRFDLPPARKGEPVMVENAAELARRLRTEAKVI